MTEDETFGDGTTTRDYASVLLVVCGVLAVALAAVLLPVAASYGLTGVPAESLVPIPESMQERAETNAGGQGGQLPASGSGGGSLGALNVGDTQAVGGSLADENQTSAFRSQNTAVHFVVQSPESAYWRTGAYDTYTGDGWSKSGPSDTTTPLVDRELQYRVELKQGARTVPTVWRPTSVGEEADVSLTDSGVARASEPLGPGTSYVATSEQPPRNRSVLRASGGSYPADIERRYTTLPNDTRKQVAPFTSNLTENASSPYETAVRIETWLESNKEYSLSVEEPPDDDVASQFIFEMEAGYCEYFATSMVVMLRSQDIPARYVIGYSTGQEVAENTYEVRGMNAHAWVEVYFEGVGWVRFDPTPGQARLQQEQESFNEAESGSYSPEEEGSPGEVMSPNGTTSTDQGTPTPTPTPTPANDTETTPEPPGGVTPEPPDNETNGTVTEPAPATPSGDVTEYDVSLNRSAVPGATVAVTVTDGATPVPGVKVLFNGDSIGVTDAEGTVVGTVPYARSLNVTLRSTTDATTRGVSDGLFGLPPPGAGSGGGADGSSGGADGPVPDNDSTDDNATVSYELSTTATVAVSGEARTGSTVVVTATLDEVPVRNATVLLDNRTVGRTDADGQARVRLPDEAGNVTVRVRRGPVSATTRLRLDRLSLTVDPPLPLPVAGTQLRGQARLGDDPAANATVSVDDRVVGRTGVNGTFGATLPFAATATVAVTQYGQTRQVSVSNPLANAAAVVAMVLAVTAVGAVAVSRFDLHPRSAAARVRALARTLYRALVRWLVGVTVALETAARLLRARAARTLAHLRALATGRRSTREVAGLFRLWAVDRLTGLRQWVRATGLGATTGSGESTAARAEKPDAARVTIREAWARFLGAVSQHDAYTKTPGQLATHAIRVDGLPREAVRTLRDEFRAVEYGPRSPEASVPRVEAAIEAIEDATRPDGDASEEQQPATDDRDQTTGDGGGD